MIQNAEREFFKSRKGFVVHKPIHVYHMLWLVLRIAPDGIILDFLFGFGELFWLPFDSAFFFAHWRVIELLQIFVHDFQTVINIVVPAEVNARVGRMVETLMEFSKLFKAQFRNDGWIASTIDSVRIVWENGALGSSVQERIGRRIDTLHFVVNNSFVGQRVVLFLQFQVPPFLRMNVWIIDGSGVENSVGINIDQVVKVLDIL
mmetsp:Transcript_17450/g.38060  ORF Transcript_17450/g.38060 Transcript_17450/m.38060 type:complete len:204 (+) Transcript_17450:2175-2786(+)